MKKGLTCKIRRVLVSKYRRERESMKRIRKSKRGFQRLTETKRLTDKSSDSKDFKSATKFVSRCLEKLERSERLILRKIVAKTRIMSCVLAQKKSS